MNETNNHNIEFNISKKGINPNEIEILESFGNYTMLYLQDGKKVLSSKTLKRFEEKLHILGFVRVNRQILLNPKSICTINPQTAVLKNGQTFSVSRRRRKGLLLEI